MLTVVRRQAIIGGRKAAGEGFGGRQLIGREERSWQRRRLRRSRQRTEARALAVGGRGSVFNQGECASHEAAGVGAAVGRGHGDFYFWRLIAVGAAPGVRTQRDDTTMILQNLQRGTSLSFAVWHIAEPDFNE
jgi:hypothetical protein